MCFVVGIWKALLCSFLTEIGEPSDSVNLLLALLMF